MLVLVTGTLVVAAVVMERGIDVGYCTRAFLLPTSFYLAKTCAQIEDRCCVFVSFVHKKQIIRTQTFFSRMKFVAALRGYCLQRLFIMSERTTEREHKTTRSRCTGSQVRLYVSYNDAPTNLCSLHVPYIYVCTTTFLGNTGWYVFARFWYILGKQVVKGSRRTMLLAAVLWSCCCCAAFCAVLCCCAALTDWLTQQMINSRIGVNQTLNNTRQDTWVSR